MFTNRSLTRVALQCDIAMRLVCRALVCAQQASGGQRNGSTPLFYFLTFVFVNPVTLGYTWYSIDGRYLCDRADSAFMLCLP